MPELGLEGKVVRLTLHVRDLEGDALAGTLKVRSAGPPLLSTVPVPLDDESMSTEYKFQTNGTMPHFQNEVVAR